MLLLPVCLDMGGSVEEEQLCISRVCCLTEHVLRHVEGIGVASRDHQEGLGKQIHIRACIPSH